MLVEKLYELATKDEELMIYNQYYIIPESPDPLYWDIAYLVSFEYATKVWYIINNPIENEKRRKFWLWYIKEAVPQAYLAFED